MGTSGLPLFQGMLETNFRPLGVCSKKNFFHEFPGYAQRKSIKLFPGHLCVPFRFESQCFVIV